MSVLTSIFANILSKITQYMSNFPQLKVVGRGGETQLQVAEN